MELVVTVLETVTEAETEAFTDELSDEALDRGIGLYTTGASLSSRPLKAGSD